MAGWRDGDRKRARPTPPASIPGEPGPRPPSRSGWRAPSSGIPGAQQHWKQGASRKSLAPRQAWLAGFLLLFVGLVGLLVWSVVRVPRSVPFVALVPAPYQFPLTPLPLVKEDLDRFKDLLGPKHKNVVFEGNERGLNSSAEFLEELRYRLEQPRIRAGGPAKDVIIVYVRAHGIVDDSGAPCFLMPSSRTDDQTTWLPVEQVFATACNVNAEARYLFLIDGNGLRRFWPAGMLHNTFSQRLEDLLHSQQRSQIVAILAAGKGQVSHAAPELGGTPFAYFSAIGIRGAADRNEDDEVTIHELHQYLVEQVDRFANVRRADAQTPLLIPAICDDHAVAHAGNASQLAEPQPLPIPDLNTDSLWSDLVELRAAKAFARHPAQWAELESRMVRLESLVICGEAYAAQRDPKVVSELLQQLRQGVQVDPQSAASLAAANRAISTTAMRDAAAQVTAWKESLGTEKPEPAPHLAEPLASHFAWLEAVHGQDADWSLANQLLGAAGNGRSIPYNEIQFAKLLFTFVDSQGATIPERAASLRCQELAEQAAAIADDRAHYWNQHLVLQADALNDRIIDAMLIGSASSARQIETDLSQLSGPRGSYRQALEIGELTTRAYALRDEAWATIPHLAAWLDSEAWLDGARVQTDGQTRADRYSPTLDQLIEETHRLADTIDRLPRKMESSELAASALQQLVDQTQLDLVTLLGEFDEKCNSLLHDDPNDERTMRQIAAVLELPLIPNGDPRTRKLLRAKLMQRRADTYTNEDQATDDAHRVEDDTSYTRWLTDQPTIHCMALLTRGFLDAESDSSLSKQLVGPSSENTTHNGRLARAEELQQRLRSLLNTVEPFAIKLANQRTEGPPVEVRAGLSKADRLVRAACGILGRRIWTDAGPTDDPVGIDPVARLAEFDRHAIHLWQGGRALRNWWASVDQLRPYFALAAEHQLAGGSAYAALPPKNRFEIEQAKQDQERLRVAVVEQEQILESWRPAVQTPPIQIGDDELNHSISTIPAEGLPIGGRAAVYLSGDNGLLPVYEDDTEVRRRSADLERRLTLHHVIRNAKQSLVDGRISANLVFRGHLRNADSNVEDPGQAVVVWNELQPSRPRITVTGDSKEKSQVIFVLDCSGSMKTAYRGNESRFDVAIETLRSTISKLSDDNYVGLVLYGHRNSWRNFKQNEGVNPVYDVERARGIAINDEAGKRDLIRVLEEKTRQGPRGETPLYLAIKTALESFQSRPDGLKQVVVISDGFQQLPPGYGGTSSSDVNAAWTKFEPRLDIVPMVGNLTPEQQTILSQLTNLSGPYGKGTLHQQVDATNLAKTIEDALNLRKFWVTDLKSQANSDRLPLGETWTESGFDSDWNLYDYQRNYEVHVDSGASCEVTLEGGEYLRLAYNQRRNRLEIEPFLSNSDGDRIEVTGSEFYAISHYPRSDTAAAGVVFQTSIQNLNREAFPQRPKHVWAEIQPNRFGDQSLIQAFDCDFQIGTPVPVFQFRIRDASRFENARMKLWFTYDERIAGEQQVTIPLNQAAPIAGPPGVSLRAVPKPRGNDTIELVIVETHETASNRFPLRVRLIPPAENTEHYVYAGARRVRHVFTLPKRATIRVGVSSKSHLEGWLETESFDVTLPNR